MLAIMIWSITNNIKFKALDQLLVIFNKYGIKCPRTSRTLLKSNSLPRNIHSISNFLYYRFHYIPFIKNFISKLKLDNDKTIQFSLNIDGLLLFKNSSSSVWPILASIN